MTILQPGQSYSFAEYFKMPHDSEDILKELGCNFRRSPITLPTYQGEITGLDQLRDRLDRYLSRVSLVNEVSRREVLIAPTLFELCEQINCSMKIGYAMNVSPWLKGTADYFIPGSTGLLVVEAKQADTTKGFTQLAVELIALDQWLNHPSPILYGVVTTGEIWRFGVYHRDAKQIVEDRTLYQLPSQLETLMRIFVGILSAKID
jgi:hypothetical protein